MVSKVKEARPTPHTKQRGQVMILTVILIAMAVFAALMTTITTSTVSIVNRQAEQTAKAMAEVKQALIGWSAARDPAVDGVNARPGELPCPDINPLDGYEDGSCVAGAIGRVPWKTLRIPEPKDASGETLWYSVSGPFRVYSMSSGPITSDTLGTLTVYQNTAAATITSQAIAVIVAPGPALDAQNRSATETMACTAPSGTYPRNQCASNYLESASGVNNATINGPFINGQASDSFNDRVLAITNADLMPAVEIRVAREMRALLELYRLARVVKNGGGSGDYPAADISDGKSNDRYNRQRFPCNDAKPSKWGEDGTPFLPNWLTNGCDCRTGTRGWNCVIFYAVAAYRLKDNNCDTCASSTITCPGTSTTSSTTRLTVTNASNSVADVCPEGGTCAPAVLSSGTANLVLITPGAATSNRAGGWPESLNPISGYFEDSSNASNDNYNCYVVPTSTANDRDRILVVPYP